MNCKKGRKTLIIIVGFALCFTSYGIKAQGNTNKELPAEVKKGMDLFQGTERFALGGPSCVSCHNVTNENLIPGGLFAKDLTGTTGVVAKTFAQGLPNPVMKASYENNPIDSLELEYLAAFFDYASENKNVQTSQKGFLYFLIGGGIGLIILLVLIQLIWNKRKYKMVKEDIFRRQSKAWDAKF